MSKSNASIDSLTLLLGAPSCAIDRLQKIQNRAARLVSLTKPRDHITPVLVSLHWLPIRERTEFKIACIVFKCLNELGPEYLSELLNRYTPARSLRSENSKLLTVPKYHSAICERSFSIGGPKVWNNLNLAIKGAETLSVFRKLLKTSLFRNAYPYC